MLLGASADTPPSDAEVRSVLLQLLGAEPETQAASATQAPSVPCSAPQSDNAGDPSGCLWLC